MGGWVDRSSSGALSQVCRWIWGCSPAVVPGVVESRGGPRAAAWFVANLARFLVTLRVLGPLRTHLACTAISLYNGNSYCAYGHARAMELVYFRDRDRLLPVDARALSTWGVLPERQIAGGLRMLLEDAGLHAETLWLDRTLDLAAGRQFPVDQEEMRLAHLVRMVGVLNDATTTSPISPEVAMDPVNKDATLKARWAIAHAQLSG